MTKSELIDALAERRGIPRQIAEEVVHTFFEQMKETLCEGGRIEFRGFGSFKVRDYPAYIGRNPRTLERIQVPPKRLPVFKVSKLMKIQLNQTLEG
ncbi:MAG: HU family DNA-binding protein [Myxococcota bacterium]